MAENQEKQSLMEGFEEGINDVETGIQNLSEEKLMKEQEQKKEEVIPVSISEEFKIATDIDAFMYDYDTFSYNDQVEDRANYIQEIAENIKNGNTSAIKNYLIGIDFNDQPKEHLEASKLMKEIYQYEMYHYPRQLTYEIEEGYFTIHDCNEGFDYSFYDKDYNLIDGGIYHNIEVNIYEAIHEVMGYDDGFSIWNREDVKQVRYKEFMKKVENMELSKEQGSNIVMGNDTLVDGAENENTRQAVEMNAEQNFHITDGIIEDKQAGDTLKQDTKNGKSDSVRKRLNATRREQKQQPPKIKKENKVPKKSTVER